MGKLCDQFPLYAAPARDVRRGAGRARLGPGAASARTSAERGGGLKSFARMSGLAAAASIHFFGPRGLLARALPTLRGAAGADAPRHARSDEVLTRRRRAAGRGGHRHRQDPGLPAARGGAGPAGGGLHRHQEPAGAAHRQGHPAPGPGPRPRPQRGGHEGPRQLPLPAALPLVRPGGQLPPLRRDPALPRGRGLGAGDGDGRPRRGRGPARRRRLLARDLRGQRELHRPGLPRLRPLLGDAHAAARARGRPRGREPPPALRRPRGQGRELRRGDPRLRHA